MYPYDRINIVISGQEITARPIEYMFDNKGAPSDPIQYETTCPSCSQLVQFPPSSIISKDDISYVMCTNCRKDPFKLMSNINVVVKATGQQIFSPRQCVDNSNKSPFIDPIEAGIFQLTRMEFGE